MTVPTASPAWPDGAQRARRWCYRSIPTWKTFLRIGRRGIPSIRKARALSESLFEAWHEALLFRTLATLRLDVPVFDTTDELRWKGPGPAFEAYCHRLKAPDLLRRVKAAECESSA